WEDYRHGEPKYFAQRFDAAFLPVGENIEHYGNSDITFAPNGSHLAVREYYDSWEMPDISVTSYAVCGKVFNTDLTASSEFFLAGHQSSWCGMGFRGNYIGLASTSNAHIFFSNNSGPVTLKKIDFNGNIILDSDSTEMQLPRTSFTIAAASNQSNEYAVFWKYCSNFEFDPEDTLSSGIYGIFFSQEDSIYKYNVPVKTLPENTNYITGYYDFKAVTTNDTCYSIFYIDSDSFYVSKNKVDREGFLIGEEVRIPLFHAAIPVHSHNIFNFSFTPIKDGYFYLLVTFQSYLSYFSTLIKFDEYGNQVGEPVHSSDLSSRVGNNFIIKEGSNLVIPLSKEDDVFIAEMENFNITSELKINTDQIGSNESSPTVASNNDKFLVNWYDEKFNSGKFISPDGSVLSERKFFEPADYLLFSDGNIVGVWKKYSSDNLYKIGFTIYNHELTPLSNVELITGNQDDLRIVHTILPDETFIIFYRNAGELYLKRFSKEGELLNESQFSGWSNLSSLRIFLEGDDSFWITNCKYFQKYSKQLQSLTPVYDTYAQLYVGDEKTVTFRYEYNYLNFYVNSLNGDSVAHKKMGIVIKEYNYGKIGENSFLLIYKTHENKIYACAYTNSGVQIKSPVLIHDNITVSRKMPSFGVCNDKILFVWADDRIKENGYSIYGRIFNLDSFTGIDDYSSSDTPDNFELHQNYPNPFNPVTTIKFSIPTSPKTPLLSKERGRGEVVTLKVYDILGREVAVLVNEEKAPGNYEVVFDA
ncbi:MAG TPA: hypothetical protein PK397_14135, partial [Ignavibacteriaceae bacterium]|nr:hypothetical protein [Ignavibacteriaceae bacterium]